MLSLNTTFDKVELDGVTDASPRSVAALAKALKVKRPISLREVIFVGMIDVAVKSYGGVLPDASWTAVGVIQGDLRAVRYYKGRRLARDGQTDEPNADTLFYMGSLTKTFTAALLARTIEKTADDHYNPLTLNSLVLKLTAGSLPPEVYAAANPWSVMLTLVELAQHKAGLPRNSKSSPRVVPNDAGKWTYVRLFKDLYELGAPDLSITYSNFGYQLLGWSLALKWGIPWETLLATEITTPLGMTETKVYEDLNRSQIERIADGDVPDEEIPATNKLPGAAKAYHTTNPGGRLLATGPDMLKWLAFNLGLAGSPRDSLLGIVFKPAGAPKQSLGWLTKGSGASLTFLKDGAHGTYRATIRFSPTSPKGLFVMTNVPSGATSKGLREDVWKAVFG